jgi:hypothetical protein
MFHALLGVAGLFGLVSLAFGEGAAVRLAQIVIVVAVMLAILLGLDVMTHGRLSDML